MKYLIDTNVFIPLEPTAPGEIEPLTSAATSFAQKANRAGFPLFVHPAQTTEILHDRDDQRRSLRSTLLGKYPVLPEPPTSARVDRILGQVPINTHHWVDHQLVAALDAVDDVKGDRPEEPYFVAQALGGGGGDDAERAADGKPEPMMSLVT